MLTYRVSRRGLVDRIVQVGDSQYTVYYCESLVEGNPIAFDGSEITCHIRWLDDHMRMWAADGCIIIMEDWS